MSSIDAMSISWLFLGAALWGGWFTWNAYRPIYRPSGLATVSFFAGWLTTELADLERLADEGDTLEVVAKLGAIVRAPKREMVPGPAIPVPATPAEVSSGSEALPRTEA